MLSLCVFGPFFADCFSGFLDVVDFDSIEEKGSGTVQNVSLADCLIREYVRFMSWGNRLTFNH